jgi:hypothetical protein
MTAIEHCPGAWIQTYTGGTFCPFAPRVEDLDIRDIAHHLSNESRFAGATRHFYSVAQHSLYVRQMVPKDAPVEYKLWALLHDAAEAYLKDLPRPIKHHPFLYHYRLAEQDILLKIQQKWDLGGRPRELDQWDHMMLLAERDQLMPPLPDLGEWDKTVHGDKIGLDATNIVVANIKIDLWWPSIAESLFLLEFENLMSQRAAGVGA